MMMKWGRSWRNISTPPNMNRSFSPGPGERVSGDGGPHGIVDDCGKCLAVCSNSLGTMTSAVEEGGCDELMARPRSSDVKSWSMSAPGGVFSGILITGCNNIAAQSLKSGKHSYLYWLM